MSNCTHDAADPEMCIMCLRAERDALRAKLDASERACADHKAFLNALRLSHDLDVPEEVWSALFGTDAGRDYVPRSEVDKVIATANEAIKARAEDVDAARRKGMTDALDHAATPSQNL